MGRRPFALAESARPSGQWYGSADSVRIAENVLSYQNDNGGWPKNIDMARQLNDDEKDRLRATHNQSETLIDNGATWTQIRFLALVHEATGDAAVRRRRRARPRIPARSPIPQRRLAAVLSAPQGLLLAHHVQRRRDDRRDERAPRRGPDGKKPFEFVDADLRERRQQAIDKGLDVILQYQVVVDGRPTVWCAQHDEIDSRAGGGTELRAGLAQRLRERRHRRVS